jgi:hypothetical protein
MSENLSIDEIIARAEQIKAEAEKQLAAAEKSLEEKTKVVIDEVTVDANEVLKNVASISEPEEIKAYTPAKDKYREKDKTQSVKLAFGKKEKIKIYNIDSENDDDMKIAGVDDRTKPVHVDKKDETKIVNINDEQTKKLNLKKNNEEKTRPVAFSSNSKFDEENDLQEIPTIVARDRIYDGFDAIDNNSEFEEEIGVQMSFEGFDDVIETVPTIDENVAEQILEQRRQEKVGKFRLFGPDETDKELGDKSVVEDEYRDEGEKKEFLNSLLARKNSVQVKLLITLVLGIPMLLMTAFKDSAYFPTALSSNTVYFVVMLVLLIATIVVNFNVIIHGFNLKKGINFDLPISVMTLLVVVHTVLLMVDESIWIDNGVCMASAVSFGLFMSQLGKHQMLVRVIDNFEFITSDEDRYTVENIANSVDANIISRGFIDVDEPIIKTSVKTDFPTNFFEISCKNEPADKISRVLGPISLVLSLILLVVVGVLDNFNTGINVAICALAVTTPVATLFLTNNTLNDISASLDSYGSRVCGYEGAVMASDANAMVMEAADLFGKNSCDLHGIKTFNGAKVDDAIIQTAAVIIQTKSPLAHVFDDVIIGKQSILPKVEGITYEDKMGTSAWIYKRKVLVGNRDLLIHHGVNVPKESFEQRYTRKGRKALYLAVGGKIIAMFVVSYSADPDLKRGLKKLEKSGITIIVKSSDPYINEQSISSLFALPEGFIRVMNYSSARVFDKYSDLNVEKSPAYLVHNGTAKGLICAMHASGVAISTRGLIAFLTCFGCAIGFAILTLLAVVRGYSEITAVNIISFQLIWNLFVLIVSKIRRIGM